MTYEWYSGSDSSRHVPAELARLKREGEAAAGKPTIAALQALLTIEQESNWRGYLLARIGHELLAFDRRDEGIAVLLEAESQFDPLLPTIRSVLAEYCDAIFSLVVGYYFERRDFGRVAALAMSVVAHADESGLCESDLAAVFFYQGFALEMLAKSHSLHSLHPLALASYLKWHRLDPDDPACLEHLTYSYYYNGDMSRSTACASMCLEVAPNGEIRERIEAFLKDHMRELSVR